MITELAIILALVVVNGLFAGAEIAVLTANKAKVQQRAAARDRRARAVQALRDAPERFLATVQIGITVVGAAAAAFGGASLARKIAPGLEGTFGTHANDAALVIVVAGVSFLSLVLGELVPKSLALRYANGYAFLIGRPLLGLARLVRPLVWLLTACSNLVLRMFGDRTSFVEGRMSRDELRELVEEAARSGSVDRHSSTIAAQALELPDVMVGELMVRRDRVVTIRHDAPPDEVQRILLEEGFSRMPVCRDGDLDRVLGYIVARDVLALAWERNLIALRDIIRPLVFVPIGARASAVLRELQARHVQIAIVIDEHGGTAGLVTMEDLVEEVVGDIFGERDLPDETTRVEADGTALVPGWVPTRRVNRALHTSLPITRESMTIAGVCMALALAVPPVGAKLASPDGTVLEVVEASPRRVRMVRVHRPPAPEGEPT
ncbi:MAG: HlyC/CorC family transporter [Deltaproteobacteria bacterium]|nr:HlyC/CorC family transporter [Deltaproteobacteria bacterium]MCW5805507.1 HlyC/CorC family transporter [Deltaproteobacteria bacterium]